MRISPFFPLSHGVPRVDDRRVVSGPKPERIMIDATHLKAHRTAASLLKSAGRLFPPYRQDERRLELQVPRSVRREGRPLVLMLSEGQMSDHKGARLMLDALPPASSLIGDRVYDSNWFREALTEKGIKPCIPPTKSRSTTTRYSTGNAIASKTCSQKSRTGAASLYATIAAHSPSSQQSVSPLQ